MSQYKIEKSYKYLIKQYKQQEQEPNQQIRMYADGVYDGFHYGHARQLQQAKLSNNNVYLIAGVSGQSETQKLKGKTLMDEMERTLTVNSCCWVDEVLCPCPWEITTEFLEVQNISYVAHDALPYQSAGCNDIYSKVKQLGKFFETHRTEGISTSDLIQKIINNRDELKEYLWKQGVKRNQLGVNIMENMWLKCKFFIKAFWGLNRKKKQAEENLKDE